MTVDWAKFGWDAVGFLVNNWVGVVSFFGFVKVWYDNKDKVEAEQAREKVLAMAVDAVKLVAQETLGNKEKRERAIAMVIEAMPDNIEKHVPKELVGQLVEKAWLQIVKPNL